MNISQANAHDEAPDEVMDSLMGSIKNAKATLQKQTAEQHQNRANDFDDSSVVSNLTHDFPLSPNPKRKRSLAIPPAIPPESENDIDTESLSLANDSASNSSQVVSLIENPSVEIIGDGNGDGQSIEGSDQPSVITEGDVGSINTQKSKCREPTNPQNYNAVTISIIHASGIRKWDASCDPFVLCTVGKPKTSFSEKLDYLDETGYHDSLYETVALENTTEPMWRETTTIIFPPGLPKYELHLQLQDKDMSSGDDLGEVKLKLTSFICDDPENPTECDLPLEGPGAGDNEPTIFVLVNFANVDDFTDNGSTISGSLTFMDSSIENGNSTEEKKELLHTGEWVPQVFDVGRFRPWTGIYTCCGDKSHFGMYCESLGARVEFAHKYKAQKDYEINLPIKRAAAKEKYNKWLAEKEESVEKEQARIEIMEKNDGEEPLTEYEEKHFFASASWKKEHGIFREPKSVSETQGVDEKDLYELRMRRVKSSDISMVVSTMRKNPENHWMVDQGLEILKRLLVIPDAQKKCLTFGALPVVISGMKHNSDNYNLQLKGMIVLAKYVSVETLAGLTEKALVNPDVTDVAITRLKLYRDKEAMVKNCLEVLRVTSTFRKNRTRIFEMGAITHVTCVVVGFRHNVDIVCPAFLLLETIGSMNRGRTEILERGLVKIALSIMQQYEDNQRVLAASMGMLLLACEDEKGLVQMLSSNGVATTLYAMKHLVNQAELQQRGLEFMKKLSLTRKGGHLLDGIKGSWQWLAQGTVSGNALIHQLDGNLKSTGWAMGDINEADVLNKGKLFNSTSKSSGARGEARAQWTASGLKKFMGLSQKEQTLKSSLEEHTFYFQTIRDLGLLPRNNEVRETWFGRVKRYEDRNGIDIDNLVARNQVRVFGGTLPEDRPYSDSETDEEYDALEADEETEEDEGEKKRKAIAEKKKEWTKAKVGGGGGPMEYKEVKRKAALGRKGRAALKKPVVVEKVYEKRPIFLEGHYSHGWSKKKGSNFGRHDPKSNSNGNSNTNNETVEMGGANVMGQQKEENNNDDGNDNDNDNDNEKNNDSDDNDNDSGDDEDSTAFDDGSSNVSFADSSQSQSNNVRKMDVSSKFLGTRRETTRHKFKSIIEQRLPEKRRDVFKVRENMDLWVPEPLELAYPEVIGTHMETAAHATKEKQYTFYEDPLTFGRTKEEIAAMKALEF